MPGKRTRTASSSPNYERVVWVEKKTARGAKITAKVANSPRTPKARKWAAPHYKKRHMEAPPITPASPSAGADHPSAPPLPITLKKKTGKVCSLILNDQYNDNHLGVASR
jgi:hypothetical protein